MPQLDDDDFDDDTNDGQQQPNWRRKLEADAKAGREALARAEAAEAAARQAQRELAMRRAGVDIDSPLGTLFGKAYDGEADVDQIKAEWEKLNPGAPQQAQVPADQQQALQRIQSAGAGGAPSGGAEPDFEGELDQIPVIVNGQFNPDYVSKVLEATQVQAAREGRTFVTSGGSMKFTRGSGPATQEL